MAENGGGESDDILGMAKFNFHSCLDLPVIGGTNVIKQICNAYYIFSIQLRYALVRISEHLLVTSYKFEGKGTHGSLDIIGIFCIFYSAHTKD